ncbi:MAG: hypothetical protein J6Q53_02265 [Oscillospiraceae bacterium]|nr:hypothetical protein [Oscillospiraceae bacterium]
MENTGNGAPRRPNPRRRRRSPLRIFIDSYLPLLVIGVVIILFIVFAVGSIGRSNDRRAQQEQDRIAASQSEAQKQLELEAEASRLITEASALAKAYDYDGAIALLDSFSGNLYEFDSLLAARESYVKTKESLIAWDDPSKVVNLSFHLLIADPVRAFSDKGYASSYKWNFITTTEFSSIIQQLYDNGYVLVDIYDLFEATTAEGGSTVYKAKTLYLPEGKKPMMLTQTQVNYYTYMTDSDGDGLADKGGGGFASRLIVDSTGALTCEYVDSTGKTLTGAYDLVPILEDFIAANPDFSYKGARAVLAVSGYDGLFGYRTDPETAKKISQEYYDQQLKELPAVVDALKAKGYRMACYTYNNIAYGNVSAAKIQEDLDKWKNEVTPLLGELDILVYAKESDISSPADAYTGDKYHVLQNAGFRYFLGFCEGSEPWAQTNRTNVRQGRLMVTGNNLQKNAKLFEGLFDTSIALDRNR